MEGLIVDKFRDLKGPVTVSRDWTDELKRIDSRLVLRWQPFWGKYAVFTRFTYCGKLWSQPTHIIQSPGGGFRAPDKRDLEAIRYANYMSQKEGYKAWIEAMDRRMAEAEKAGQEQSLAIARQVARRMAEKYDLTARKLMTMAGIDGGTRVAVRAA